MKPLEFDARTLGLISVGMSMHAWSSWPGVMLVPTTSLNVLLGWAVVANAVMTVPEGPDFTNVPSLYHVLPCGRVHANAMELTARATATPPNPTTAHLRRTFTEAPLPTSPTKSRI